MLPEIQILFKISLLNYNIRCLLEEIFNAIHDINYIFAYV